MEKLLIKGCRVVDPSAGMDASADILCENGIIRAVGLSDAPEGCAVLDARGLTASPGLVDMHTHLRDPGQTYKEDIFTACAAAAAGGVTTLLAMPNTVPCADTPEVLRAVAEKAASAGVHVHLAAAATVGRRGKTFTDFASLVQNGAAAFSDDGSPVESAAVMLAAMRAAFAVGKPLISHCEDLSLAAGGLVNEGKVSEELNVPGLPAAAEEIMAARDCILSLRYGLPVHIAHISTALTAALVREFKRRGAPVTCETCPHYFSLDESAALSRDADFRMNPPLRAPEDARAMADALADGTIDCIVTDHAPHAAEEKADFVSAPNGVVGLETSLAAGITCLVRPGFLTLSALIEKMSAAPAKLLGLPCGTLAPGSPADLVLFDPGETWNVDPQKLHSRSKNTPFKGRTLFGRVKITISSGRVVYRAPEREGNEHVL